MHHRLAASLAASLLLAFGAAQAGPISYAVSYQLGGDQLTGLITTDGTLGNVQKANIIGWSFTHTGAIPFSISSVDAGAFLTCQSFDLASSSECGLTATAGELQFDFTHNRDLLEFGELTLSHQVISASFASQSGPDPRLLGYVRGVGAGSDVFYCNPCSSAAIATAVATQGVPEPGSMALAGLGLVGCFLAGQRRRPPAPAGA